MPELRWILLGLGIFLLVAIWWWGARRAAAAPPPAELREPTVSQDSMAESEYPAQPDPARDWGVPPFEPLNVHTANFEEVPDLGDPLHGGADPMRETLPEAAVEQAEAAHDAAYEESAEPNAATPAAENTLSTAAHATSPGAPGMSASAPAAELQRIVTVRIGARGDQRWPGDALLAQLHENGFVFGRYHVFHRKCTDGRTLMCAASLVEPGTFDVVTMRDDQFRGVTLFAVLPGPLEPLQTLDELFATAYEIAQALNGIVQEADGVPFTAQRAEALREDLAHFQATLH